MGCTELLKAPVQNGVTLTLYCSSPPTTVPAYSLFVKSVSASNITVVFQMHSAAASGTANVEVTAVM